jgi:putative salt-induced outer membrane protein YdiY
MRTFGTVGFTLLLMASFAVQAHAEEAADLREAIDAALVAPVPGARLVRDDVHPVGGAGEAQDPWTFELGVALSLTRGNSDKFDLLVDGKAVYETTRWIVKNEATFVYGTSEGDKTAEAWHTEHRVDRKFSERTYAFVEGHFDRDEPADLEYRITGLAGVGRVLGKGPRGSLKAEIGGGVAHEKRVGLPETTDPSAYFGIDYVYKWADGSRLTVEYDFIPNLSDFDLSRMTWDVKFGKPLCEEIDLQITLRVDYVFEPPAPVESWDVILGVGLRVRL